MKLVWQDRLLTFWMEAFCRSFLASAPSIPAVFSLFIVYISFPFALPTQQRSQNFFSDLLEQNQF